jgi:hypothetical protein
MTNPHALFGISRGRRHSDVGETTPRMYSFWVLGLGPSLRPLQYGLVSPCPALPCHQWLAARPGKGLFPIGLSALFLIIPIGQYHNHSIPYYHSLAQHRDKRLRMKRNENDSFIDNNPGPPSGSRCTPCIHGVVSRVDKAGLNNIILNHIALYVCM